MSTPRVKLVSTPRVRVNPDPEPSKTYTFPTFARAPADPIVQEIEVMPPEFEGSRHIHVPNDYTRRQASMLASFGLSSEEVAYCIGINPKTLWLHYKPELTNGKAKQNALVASRLYEIATRGQGKEAISAMIFWLKTRAGWQERIVHSGTIHHEHDHEHTINQSLTNETRAAKLLQLLNAGGVEEARLVAPEQREPMASPAGPANIGLQLPG